MGLIHEILAGLEQVDPGKAEALRQELTGAAGVDTAPPKPVTIVDEVRDVALEVEDLLVSDVPSAIELPVAVAVLCKRFQALEDRVQQLEDNAPKPTPPATSSTADSSSVGTEGEQPASAPAPVAEPTPAGAPPEPTAADVLPAVEPPPPAAEGSE